MRISCYAYGQLCALEISSASIKNGKLHMVLADGTHTLDVETKNPENAVMRLVTDGYCPFDCDVTGLMSKINGKEPIS